MTTIYMHFSKVSTLRFLVFICFLTWNLTVEAQSNPNQKSPYVKFNLDTLTSVQNRIGNTPLKILERFHLAGMKPKAYKINKGEEKIIASAFEKLPPLHKNVLKNRLMRISFLTDMPNTALTAPINPLDTLKLYTITINAAILKQTVSEWLTQKENSYYKRQIDNTKIEVNAGNLDALTYVLLHEATHILDGVLQLTPQYFVQKPQLKTMLKTNRFTKNIWNTRTSISEKYRSEALDKTYLRSHKKISTSSAKTIYTDLIKSPFVSLYALSSYHEDLAELVTLHHFTTYLNQQYQIIVTQEDTTLVYEPMKSPLVKGRIPLLAVFYQ